VEIVVSSGKAIEKDTFGAGISHGAGFFFTDVPEGEFRITNLRFTPPHVPFGSPPRPPVRYNTLGVTSNTAGELSNELSGTCNGGFIWLGTFKLEPGGYTATPTMKLVDSAVTAGNAKAEVKSQLKGTKWEAEIDKPVANTPLPKGKSPEGKVSLEDQQKAVAARANETRNAAAPPSDEGAVTAATGTWVLATVNGKPVPYLITANKCTILDSTYEMKADASYTSMLNMECGGNKFPFPTSGFFGVVGGNLTWAVKKGPAPSPKHKTTITADAMTTVTETETYVYKKK
jgi:hypothetical protein